MYFNSQLNLVTLALLHFPAFFAFSASLLLEKGATKSADGTAPAPPIPEALLSSQNTWNPCPVCSGFVGAKFKPRSKFVIKKTVKSNW